MNRFGLVVLVALFPLALWADDKKEEKKDEKGTTFTSKEGKFTVVLPDKPTEKTNKLKTVDGESDIHTFTLDQKGAAYFLSYSDSLAGRVNPDAEKVLTPVIDGSAKKLNGKVVSNEPIKLGKKEYPGREIRIEFGGEKKMVYRARVYLVGDRLYQLVALGTEEFAKSKAVNEYFKSFALDE